MSLSGGSSCSNHEPTAGRTAELVAKRESHCARRAEYGRLDSIRTCSLDMREKRSAMCDPALALGLRIFRSQQRALRLILISLSILSTAGCATITPRNVLPQASAGQIELDGFHNIRFWGDASTRDIQATMMADAPN